MGLQHGNHVSRWINLLGCVMKILKMFLKIITPIMASVLSGDLIYLYYAGGWYDPNRTIEVIELIMLYIFFITGIVISILRVKKYKGVSKYE